MALRMVWNTVVDVCIKTEFAEGHAKGSTNIALGQLLRNLSRIPKAKTVITCCASGMRSATSATQFT